MVQLGFSRKALQHVQKEEIRKGPLLYFLDKKTREPNCDSLSSFSQSYQTFRNSLYLTQSALRSPEKHA